MDAPIEAFAGRRAGAPRIHGRRHRTAAVCGTGLAREDAVREADRQGLARDL